MDSKPGPSGIKTLRSTNKQLEQTSNKTVLEIVCEAVDVLGTNKKGVSAQAIRKYVQDKKGTDAKRLNVHINKALIKGIAEGKLARPKNVTGTGATGHFILVKESKPKSSKKTDSTNVDTATKKTLKQNNKTQPSTSAARKPAAKSTKVKGKVEKNPKSTKAATIPNDDGDEENESELDEENESELDEENESELDEENESELDEENESELDEDDDSELDDQRSNLKTNVDEFQFDSSDDFQAVLPDKQGLKKKTKATKPTAPKSQKVKASEAKVKVGRNKNTKTVKVAANAQADDDDELEDIEAISSTEQVLKKKTKRAETNAQKSKLSKIAAAKEDKIDKTINSRTNKNKKAIKKDVAAIEEKESMSEHVIKRSNKLMPPLISSSSDSGCDDLNKTYEVESESETGATGPKAQKAAKLKSASVKAVKADKNPRINRNEKGTMNSVTDADSDSEIMVRKPNRKSNKNYSSDTELDFVKDEENERAYNAGLRKKNRAADPNAEKSEPPTKQVKTRGGKIAADSKKKSKKQ